MRFVKRTFRKENSFRFPSKLSHPVKWPLKMHSPLIGIVNSPNCIIFRHELDHSELDIAATTKEREKQNWKQRTKIKLWWKLVLLVPLDEIIGHITQPAEKFPCTETTRTTQLSHSRLCANAKSKRIISLVLFETLTIADRNDDVFEMRNTLRSNLGLQIYWIESIS